MKKKEFEQEIEQCTLRIKEIIERDDLLHKKMHEIVIEIEENNKNLDVIHERKSRLNRECRAIFNMTFP